jgi:hypothetical protein
MLLYAKIRSSICIVFFLDLCAYTCKYKILCSLTNIFHVMFFDNIYQTTMHIYEFTLIIQKIRYMLLWKTLIKCYIYTLLEKQ